MASIYVDIDTGQVKAMLDDMKSKLTVEQFDRLMARSLNEVGKRIKKPVEEESEKYYYAPKGFVKNSIKPPKLRGGGGQWECDIPLEGPRGTIGGTFRAEGGYYGGNPPAYKITADIVRGVESTLPDSMPSYGGQPAFRNVNEDYDELDRLQREKKKPGKQRKLAATAKAAKYKNGVKGIAMTRTGGSRLPIVSVAGLAAPQMPMNRAAPEVERRVLKLLDEQVTHNFSYMFG